MALGSSTPLIIGGLRTLADQTGCGNIVNWNLVSPNLSLTYRMVSNIGIISVPAWR